MKIGDLMDRDLTALAEEDTVEEAIEILLRHHMTGLPVTNDEGHVIGFVSEEDIIKSALPAYMSNLPSSAFLPDYGQFSRRLATIAQKSVSEVMQRHCVTFDVDETDFVVASEMICKHIKIAPVLNEGVMEGYISRAYLLKRMMRACGDSTSKESR
ncbi:MAG: HPP family protein [Pyramidobacter sp.]